MKAMVFAAGLGKRLMPLTSTIPKALVRVDGNPMMMWVLDRLHKAGVTRVVVNVFHLAELLIPFLQARRYPGMEIMVSDERPGILDTGGGLSLARQWLEGDEPVLLHNVDVISDIDLLAFCKKHQESGAMVSLAVRERPSSRKLLFNQQSQLVGWKDYQSKSFRWVDIEVAGCKELSFSGIHIISPDVFSFIPPASRFSIIDFYLELAARFPILAYRHDKDFWADLGRPQDLEQLNAYLRTPDGIKWKANYLNPSLGN